MVESSLWFEGQREEKLPFFALSILQLKDTQVSNTFISYHPSQISDVHCLSNPVKTMADTYLRQIQQAASNTWHVDCACADSWLTKLTHSTKKVHELLHIFHQTWLLYLMSVAKSDVQILRFLVSTRTSRLIICFPINCTKHLSIRSSFKSIII